ncbi:hypothetical protein CAPTEDRAFT_39629, partial [Capitella teleta]
CPDGWVEWRNTCFFLSSATDTRHSANSSCHEMDSHLAVIEDDEENLFLTKLMNRCVSALCHKIDCAGQKWTWLGDVSIDSASMDPMWEEYGPSVGTSCARLELTGKWKDSPCFHEYRYICEK